MKNLPKSKKYSFECYENALGHTVVYLCKGKQKVWLFNISDGVLGFDVGSEDVELQELGLVTEEDIYGNTVPVVTGLSTNTSIRDMHDDYIIELRDNTLKLQGEILTLSRKVNEILQILRRKA